MARIAGVDLPRDKRIEIGLTYVFGIGRSRANQVLRALDIDYNTKVRDLSDAEVLRIRQFIDANYTVEGDLRRETAQNIKRKIEIGCCTPCRRSKAFLTPPGRNYRHPFCFDLIGRVISVGSSTATGLYMPRNMISMKPSRLWSQKSW